MGEAEICDLLNETLDYYNALVVVDSLFWRLWLGSSVLLEEVIIHTWHFAALARRYTDSTTLNIDDDFPTPANNNLHFVTKANAFKSTCEM
jgi:hypothetical protein